MVWFGQQYRKSSNYSTKINQLAHLLEPKINLSQTVALKIRVALSK